MISIIIPVLNEAKTITSLLAVLEDHANEENILEVIVVDGGSKDETLPFVRNFKGSLNLKILNSKRGRGAQMNTGAKEAQGAILYFLHADTLPPNGFDQAIVDAVAQENPAGCFRMRFDSRHPVLRFSQWFTQFNYKICRGGDQSLFITTEIFNELQGYNEEFVVYEDCELINRLYQYCGFTVLKETVTTSARKYKTHGTLKLQYHFAMIHFKKWSGASPKALFHYYQKNIAS